MTWLNACNKAAKTLNNKTSRDDNSLWITEYREVISGHQPRLAQMMGKHFIMSTLLMDPVPIWDSLQLAWVELMWEQVLFMASLIHLTISISRGFCEGVGDHHTLSLATEGIAARAVCRGVASAGVMGAWTGGMTSRVGGSQRADPLTWTIPMQYLVYLRNREDWLMKRISQIRPRKWLMQTAGFRDVINRWAEGLEAPVGQSSGIANSKQHCKGTASGHSGCHQGHRSQHGSLGSAQSSCADWWSKTGRNASLFQPPEWESRHNHWKTLDIRTLLLRLYPKYENQLLYHQPVVGCRCSSTSQPAYRTCCKAHIDQVSSVDHRQTTHCKSFPCQPKDKERTGNKPSVVTWRNVITPNRGTMSTSSLWAICPSARGSSSAVGVIV